MEELQKKLKEYAKKVRRAESEQERELYSWGDDVYYDEELMELESEKIGNVIREIGVGGEKYAMECIKGYFCQQGYDIVKENDRSMELQNREQKFVHILRGDKPSYTQAGWDIVVTVREKNNDTERENSETKMDTYYVEVKTHTKGSRKKNQFLISTEQMLMAVLQEDKYVLMQVVYDYKLGRGIECDYFVNPMKCMKDGELKGNGCLLWF